jgi:trehalose-phosphatase
MRHGPSSDGPHAAVFDLDGVVTFTARLHAAAWKDLFDAYLRERSERTGEPLRPFTDEDYRTFVDGRPRYDGVRTFLASRGIELPEGEPSDPPEAETIAGLGNRKNELFRARLEREGADVDAEAVRLLRELREAGVPVGVATSSRNGPLVLEKAGLADLFDARVDGVISAELGLPGKPAPDIFLECLRRLGRTEPDATMMAEDATAGVEAGRAGGFGLVLGVDRTGHGLALREHGAHWVISDFGQVTVERLAAFFANQGHLRPSVVGHRAEFEEALGGRRPVVFLDYDGTLSPIVDRPEQATMDEATRQALRRVAAACTTVIVSGRGREDVQRLVGLDDLIYAGSHGFDIAGPDGLRLEVDPELPPIAAAAAKAMESATNGIPGILVEDKRYAVAVHYRLTPPERAADVEAAVDRVLAGHPELRKGTGKKVFELRPARDWDKGRAVLWLLEHLGLDRPDVVPLYVGDDDTDEDAFAAVEGRGIGILVTEIPRATAAGWSAQDVAEVRVLLGWLAEHAERRQ